MDKIEILRKWVAESNRIVAFTGAGVSNEESLPGVVPGRDFVPVSVPVLDSRPEIIIHSRIKMHKEMTFHGIKTAF